MEYIQPIPSAEANFGFGDLNNSFLRLEGTLSGDVSRPSSSPLALVPDLARGGPVASLNSPFPWWLVVIAIGITIILSNGGSR